MKVTMMLTDAAQVANGKLYILGGGWTMTGPGPIPSAIAAIVEVPWGETNRQHEVKLELLDGDFRPVMVPTETGNAPLVIGGTFEVGRPPGSLPGIPMSVPFAFSLGPIPLQPNNRFIWKLSIDGKSEDDWQVSFTTRPAQQGAAKHD